MHERGYVSSEFSAAFQIRSDRWHAIEKARKSFALVLFLTVFPVHGETLCPANKDVEEDMRINESELTKSNAEESIRKLQEIVSGDNENYEWITVPNALKMIEGYILKRDALENKSRIPDYDRSAFCDFMKNEAYWYD